MGSLSLLTEQYRIIEQRYKFRKCHGYKLDLEHPRTFSEKIVWRKIFDRNPLFPTLVDKYRSRDHVRKMLGDDAAGKVLVPLLSVTEDPEKIPFGDLPEEYIVKPNHGSGWSIIVDRDHPASREKIISRCRKWLRKTYGQSKLEWGYSQVRPLIMVERLLKDSTGRLVPDFKFHVFSGKVEWVFVMHDRFGASSTARYDRQFNRMEHSSARHPIGPDIPKPENFDEMIAIAEKLSQLLDYVRVDLYNVDGNIFFGEMTLYPSSGLNRFETKDFDLRMGDLWDRNREHARHFKPWF